MGTLGAQIAAESRKREAKPGRVWHLDETAVRIGCKQHWLWSAVDENGTTLDVLLQERRDTETAERFFRPRRPLLRASEYRRILQERFATWREITALSGP